MKKNVASQIIGCQMITAADGTAFTGSVTAYYTLNGGTQTIGSVGSGVCTHEGNGFHTYTPTAGETNGDHVAYTFIGTGAVPATVQVYPSFPQTVDNATNITAIKTKTDYLPSATAGAAGGVFIAGSNAATTVNFTGNLSGSVGSVTGAVGSISGITFPTNFADLSISVTAGLVDITQTAADKVWSTSARVLTAGTNIALAKGTGVTGFNDLDAAGVAAATWNAATATYGIAGSYGLLVETNLDAPVSGATAPTAAAVADAVWDEALAGHLGAGSTGNALNAAGSAGDPWSTAIPGAYGAGSAGYILGTNVDAAISAVKTDTAAILVDTNELQTDNIPGTLATIAGYIDTEIGTIISTLGTPAGASVSADVAAVKVQTAAIETDTQDIQARLPAALVSGLMSCDVTAISTSTAAADNLEASAEVIVASSALTGTLSTTQMTTNLTEVTDDHYNGRIIIWTSGVLKDQATNITDYTGVSKLLTFTAVTEAPSNGDTFVIV